MRCDEAQQLISAGIDGELSRTNAEELREHTQACASCAGVAADFRRLSQQLKSAGREILPARLESRVRLALTEVAGDGPSALVRHQPWLRQLAAMAAVCLIAVFGTWTITRHVDSELASSRTCCPRTCVRCCRRAPSRSPPAIRTA